MVNPVLTETLRVCVDLKKKLKSTLLQTYFPDLFTYIVYTILTLFFERKIAKELSFALANRIMQ